MHLEQQKETPYRLTFIKIKSSLSFLWTRHLNLVNRVKCQGQRPSQKSMRGLLISIWKSPWLMRLKGKGLLLILSTTVCVLHSGENAAGHDCGGDFTLKECGILIWFIYLSLSHITEEETIYLYYYYHFVIQYSSATKHFGGHWFDYYFLSFRIFPLTLSLLTFKIGMMLES